VKNPVFYIQYVNARIQGILAKAKKARDKIKGQGSKPLLKEPAELDLIKELIKLPDLVEEISRTYQVHKLPTYALELATSFHNFYEKCQVLCDIEDLRVSRLKLCLASQIVLKNTLRLMGIKTPERM